MIRAITLTPEQQQLALIALATLALDRPGWFGSCEDAARAFDNGPRLFTEFYRLNAERWGERWGNGLPRPNLPEFEPHALAAIGTRRR